MKLDKEFTAIRICPITRAKLSDGTICDSHGICPACGHNNYATVTHYFTLSGKWERPSILEFIFGARSRFIPKGGS